MSTIAIFILGCMVGMFLGLLLAALLGMAHRGDEREW